MSFQKIPYMETDALPSICSGKGCLKDSEPGSKYCRGCGQKRKGRHYKSRGLCEWKQPVVGSMDPAWLWIYLVEVQSSEKPVKIGYATNVKSRVSGIQTSCPYDIKLLAAFVGKVETESFLHQKFGDCRMRGEWFARSKGLDNLISQVCEGRVPDYIPGVFRDADTGQPEMLSVDKEIGI